MIPIYKDSKIYVVCPANVATGGPELLHQLVKVLREIMNFDAYIMYYPTITNPVHPEYKKYNVPYIFENQIEDNEKNILIVPEIKSACSYLHQFAKIRKVIWFLSIDNFFLSRSFTTIKMNQAINKMMRMFLKRGLFDINVKRIASTYDLKQDPDIKEANFFLAQSYEIKEFLEMKGLPNVYYLSDFINEEFLQAGNKVDYTNKEDIVVFNPRKGRAFVRKIIQKGQKHFKFIALENMSRSQVIETFLRAKVYIDFGNHPGKDRPPREAAILGCCVIVGKRGTAADPRDMPIPDKYKFECNRRSINSILKTISHCLENYANCVSDFDEYREMIKNEKQRFINDVKNIFRLV